MTTAEATISMVNRLSEKEMLDVQKYIEKIFASRKQTKKATLKKYTKQELLNMVQESVEQSKKGKVYSWEEVQKEFREEHGF